MSYAEKSYPPSSSFAAQAAEHERAAFITQTYLHLFGAVGLFVALEAVLLNLPFTPNVVESMVGGRYSWLLVLGLFMFVSWIAESWAQSTTSTNMQYMGLGLYVVAEAVIFVPILYIANGIDPYIVPTAGITTMALFTMLSAIVFITRKDFSWLRGILMFGGFAALGLIVCAIFFNFALGPIFTYAMIALACGYILYHTSNVLHHYRIGQHVAAALALFASVALLLWYVIQLFLASRD